MAKKRVDKTTLSQIFEYWVNNIPVNEIYLNFDWADGDTHCWNCGDNKQSKSNKNKVRLERCHIIPYALGGEDTPSNYVLLCHECHAVAPNTINVEYMWDWIKSNKTEMSLEGTYKWSKALELYEQRKGKIFFKDVLPNIKGDAVQILKNEIDKIGTHGNVFNVESYYTVLCEMEKNI